MNYNNIIFIGGVHGVGKTTLCNYLFSKLYIKNYSCSGLISKLNSEKINDNKRVSNVEENQDILLQAKREYLNKEEIYILDGHFCLVNSEDKIVRVPFDTFRSLGIKIILVLVDDAEKIIKRLEKRDSRVCSLSLIEELQSNEIEYAKYISDKLNIECKIINLNEKQEVMEFIKSKIYKS